MKAAALVMGVGGPLAAAGIGAWSARDAAEIYDRLDKPRWAPPAGAFGPVWSVLYAGLGVAGYRLVSRRASRLTVALHSAQLVLNAAWTPLFFSGRQRVAALSVVTALDVTIAAEIAAAARHDRTVAALLVPYLAWCLYATALNVAVSDPAAVE